MAYSAKGKELKRLKAFQSKLETAKKAHAAKMKYRDKMYSHYRGEEPLPPEVQDYIHSRLQINWIWQHIQMVIIPRIMDPDPRFAFSPVEPTDDRMAHVLQQLCKFFLRKDNFVAKQPAIVEDACVGGLSVLKVVWKQREQTIRKRVPMTPEQIANNEKQEIVSETMIVENRPHVAYVDVIDWFPDPAATSDDNLRFCYHRLWYTKKQMLAKEKSGEWKNVKDACDAEGDDSIRDYGESSDEAKARRQDKYAVYEGWFDDGTRMVVCGNVVLSDDINPYFHGQIPFVCWSSKPETRSIWGLSECDRLTDLQQAIHIKDNQRIDAVNYVLNNVIIADPTIDGVRNLSLHPGKVIHANQAQRIEQWQFNANNAPAFQESEAYLGAMQQMSGATPMMSQGDPASLDRVAATVGSIAQEEANKPMQFRKLQFRLALSRVAKMVVQLCHQYLSEFELHRILGDSIVDLPNIAPEEIPMFLDVMPESMNESIGMMTERNSKIELLNITGGLHGSQMLDGTFYDIKPTLEDVIKTYGLDPTRSFSMNPPMQQLGMAGAVDSTAGVSDGQTVDDMGQVQQ